ncbi:hypothetical protein J6590_050408 [Homalodisca vitripennis]|nr:hypothetical protein J6590_050408 [Homalodisca vitripennis]
MYEPQLTYGREPLEAAYDNDEYVNPRTGGRFFAPGAPQHTGAGLDSYRCWDGATLPEQPLALAPPNYTFCLNRPSTFVIGLKISAPLMIGINTTDFDFGKETKYLTRNYTCAGPSLIWRRKKSELAGWEVTAGQVDQVVRRRYFKQMLEC